MKLIEHFVGGNLIAGSSDRKSKVFNTAKAIAELKKMLVTANL